ncbi:hypothetical protein HBO08_15580 [Pseudomonas rhodesiae]|uniref:hypothetical protein n=1 Tax=Pseudomonas rhodesiae TaxID=76760 RepID=UPI00147280D3|nr:hypothetical protein [Pseudomonas rhodesiae]NMZ18453.1 hypothetical protein [Pseudomonas rhodesiae]
MTSFSAVFVALVWQKGVVGSIGGHAGHLRHRFGIPKAWDAKTHGSQKASAEANGPETLDFTGFQAQKKTSVDVFSAGVI